MKPAIDSLQIAASWMDPMLPSGGKNDLENIASELISKADVLANQVHPVVAAAVRELLRSVSSYHSNLIEGHAADPSAIDRALHRDFSANAQQRALQLRKAVLR